MRNFEACVRHILAAEGGLVQDPHDPGGLTHFGISQRAYPTLDIKALTVADAMRIYQRDYWDPIQGEDLPTGVDLVMLDHAVNAGPATAIRLMQYLVRVVVDGVLGPRTLAGITSADPEDLITAFTERRLAYYHSLPNWRLYQVGWSRRAQRAKRAALAMAREAKAP